MTPGGMHFGMQYGFGPGAGGSARAILEVLGWPEILAWWDADRSDLVALSSTSVTSFRDSKSGYDLTQGVSGARPTYSATSFNGAPSVTFDGTDDYLEMASQPFPSGASPSEMWSVLQSDALAADITFRMPAAYGGDTTPTTRRFQRQVSGTPIISVAVGDGVGSTNVQEAAVDFTGRHALRAEIGATASAITVNGGTRRTGAVVPATGTSRFRMGCASNLVPFFFFQGKIRDLLVATPLSADKAAFLQALLLSRRMS